MLPIQMVEQWEIRLWSLHQAVERHKGGKMQITYDVLRFFDKSVQEHNNNEQLKKIVAMFPQNCESILFNIEEVFCNKWNTNDNDARAVAEAMIAQGQDKKEAQQYYNDNSWGYSDALEWLEQEFGPLAKLAVLYNRYNGQVCNGGHAQYYDNGYASQGGGFFESHGDSTELHEELISLFEQHAEIPSKQAVLGILKDFELEENTYTCDDCGGSGEHDEEDEDGEIVDTYTCDSCGGDGELEDGYCVRNSEKMDDRWYVVNDQIEKEMNAFLARIIPIV